MENIEREGALKKADRRVRYTKQVLRQSLLELLEQKPITKITVKEICDKADINRATFYAHYNDAFDLLDRIEDELIDTIRQSIGMINESTRLSSVHEICEAIQKNSDICNILFSEYGDRDLIAKILELIRDDIVMDWLTPGMSIKKEDIEYVYAFTTNGSIGIIRTWQKDGFSLPPAQVAAMITGLTASGLSLFVSKK